MQWGSNFIFYFIWNDLLIERNQATKSLFLIDKNEFTFSIEQADASDSSEASDNSERSFLYGESDLACFLLLLGRPLSLGAR